MRSVHRVVVGGGFGLLAMAGVASSVAFACTSQARLTIPSPDSTQIPNATEAMARPGETITVESRGFVEAKGNHVGYGPAVFTWNGLDGMVLGTASGPIEVVLSSGSTATTWRTQITIPSVATPSTDPYLIMGSQKKADGSYYVTGSLPVYVLGEIPQQPKPNQPVVPPVTPSDPAVTAEPTVTPPVAGEVAAPAQPAPALQTGGPASSPAAVRQPSAPVTDAVVPASRPVAGPTAPAAGRAPAAAADPTKPLPIPAPNEIWSGIDSGVSATALLDAPVPTSSGGGVPAGAVLLGLGVVALAGTAAVAGRRRLALARAVR